MTKEEIEENIDIQKAYGEVCRSSVEEFLQKNKVSEKGLTTEEVQKRQAQYGKNEMKQTKPKKWYHYLWQSFVNPFNLILVGITAVLFYTDVILTEPPSYANITVIVALILISTFLEFFEVFKSNKAAGKPVASLLLSRVSSRQNRICWRKPWMLSLCQDISAIY